ncbi:MAG: potassium channel family protein [Candidatus Sigynarchaeota archaeon]
MSKLKKKFKPAPISLKEILHEMKTSVDVMFDLAFSAILFQSKEITEEAVNIDDRVHELTDLLGYQVLQAKIGHFSESRKLEPVITLGYAIDKISEALSDIAKVVRLNGHLAQFFQLCWKADPEPIIKVAVSSETAFCGKKWDDIPFKADYGVDVIAIYHEKKWIFDEKAIINKGDILIVSGELPALAEFKKICKSEEPISFDLERKQPIDLFDPNDEKTMAVVKRLKENYVRITDMSETIVDLAFASLFFGNLEIAEDVIDQEHFIDNLIVDLERDILTLAKMIPVPERLLGLMRIVFSCELISDAASSIAENLLKGFEPHEVIVAAFSEAWDVAVREVLAPGSFLKGKTVAEVHVPKHSKGFHIIAIKRDNDWIYDIKMDFKLRAGDIVIGIGPKEQINFWRTQVNPNADVDD